MRIVDVAVIPPIPGHEVLSYSIPPGLEGRVVEGMRVLVPLGRRQVTGIVVTLRDADPERSLKHLLDVPDDQPLFGHDLLELCRFASNYYMASLAEVFSTAVLAGLRAESRRTVRATGAAASDRTPGKREREVLERLPAGRAVPLATLVRALGSGATYDAIRSLAVAGVVEVDEEPPRARARARYERTFTLDRGPSPEEEQQVERRAPAQHRLLQRLRTAGPAGLGLASLGGARARLPLRALIGRGWVREEQREVYRQVVQGERPEAPVTPTAEQQAALRAIREASEAPRYETLLVHGITGSGKTEVYFRAAEEVIARNRGVLYLVPEIGLTAELVGRVLARFGSAVALLHSARSPGERWDEWRRLSRREARLLVGVRSAVFAPLPDLGLVIVDEEHDGAYKQEDGLRYNARDLAIVRARNAGCPVLLGSATPSIESHWNALQGRYRRVALPDRIEKRPLPTVELVDLRQERPEGQPAIFTPRLRHALEENFREGNQSLLFLNRRGFAHYLLCTLCGHVIGCPNCSVTLTYHLRRRLLRCHHCDFRLAPPDACPQCQAAALHDIGFGTEQVETALRLLLPEARVARMDRDTTSRRGAHGEILAAWRRERIDILVGTQMITKGHDVPGVTFVGVVAADQALGLPDFRAAERTFQMLTQVSGRAGRGERPGRVLIQTYRPDHYALQFAVEHDFLGFAAHEMPLREALAYPPFSRLVKVGAESLDPAHVEEAAREVAESIRAANLRLPTARRIQVLGPAPAPLERLRSRFRWQLLLKGREPAVLRSLVRPALDTARRRWRAGVRLAIDVDPYGML